jgi:hypothetical protein
MLVEIRQTEEDRQEWVVVKVGDCIRQAVGAKL